MQTLNIWQLSALIIQSYLYGFTIGVVFKPCPHALLNGACNMTCEVPDFSQIIQINCNGSTRGSCLIFGCDGNMIKEGGTLVHLNILSLSYNDSCTWTCVYGSSSSSPLFTPVYSGYSSTPSLTSQQNGDVVNLTATAECLYPSNPNVVVQYKEQGGQYISLSQPAIELQSSSVQGVCTFDIENRITAISDVSGRLAGLGGKSVFFRMKFLQYSAAMPSYTNEEGPFYFNKSSSTQEENKSSTDGYIIGGVVSVFALGGAAGVAGFYYKKKRKGGMSQDKNGDLENNTGSNATENEEGKRSPPTSASKIQLADKLKS